jgi:pimeloyl-ACP methyl ester carboxylesterase
LGHSIGDFSLTNFSTNQSDLRSAVSFAQTAINAPLFLIGHSFGAACSLSVAQSLPDVRGVVSIAGPSDTRHLAEFLAKMDPAVEVNGTGSVHIGGRNYIIRKQMLEDFRRHDLPATLRNLAKPVLLFHSPADETLGYDHVLRIFACLNQRAAADPDPPPSSLITVPGADHLFVKDPADIDFVVSIVTGWVERMVSS